MVKVKVYYQNLLTNKDHSPVHNVPNDVYDRGPDAINEYLKVEVQKWNSLNRYKFYRDVDEDYDIIDDRLRPSVEWSKIREKEELLKEQINDELRLMSTTYSKSPEEIKQHEKNAKDLVTQYSRMELTAYKYQPKR